MKKLFCLFLSLFISFQIFAFEVFETEKNKSYMFKDYKHLVREFDDFCYYADLALTSEDVYFERLITNENTQRLNMSKDYIVYKFFDEFDYILVPRVINSGDIVIILMQRIDGEVYVTTTLYEWSIVFNKKETLDKKTEVKKTTNQQTLSDDIPVQMSKNNKDDTEVEISFMSFDKDSVGKNVREYFDTNNIKYKAYSTWRSSGSQDSETFEIEDIKYHGASFSLIEIVISSGDGYFTTDKMDTIDCYFLTEADYEVFISYLKQNYPYSDKSKVFYGKSRLSSKFAEYIYYDEISCDKQKLKVTYDFSVKREHEIELTNETLVGYEPFETVDEVRSVCNPSDGKYTSTIPINDLKGHQYKFQSAVQLEENGKKVLYITIQNWLTWESITISAEEALRTFICNERPFGKEVTKRPEN